jgi:hypothetical protein
MTMSLDISLTIKQPACVHCGREAKELEVFSSNITHNLVKMAEAAGVYDVCWRPDEEGITKASQLLGPLTVGIAILKADPLRFEAFNAPNGWGLYDNFVPWLEGYLAACIKYPEAEVRVSR